MIGRRILDRYLAREFMRLFLMFALAAPVLFVLGEWTDNVGAYADRGLTTGEVLKGYMYAFPLFISWSFPIAALIATVFTVSNMARHSELAAAKAGGISFLRTTAVLPVLGVFFTIIGLGLTEIVPVTMARKAEIMKERPSLSGQTRHSFVYRARNGTVYSVRQLDPGAQELHGLTMAREGSPPETPHLHASAPRATYAPESGWTLHDGYLRRYGNDESEFTIQFASMRQRGFYETPEQLLAIPKDPEEMRYAELSTFIEILERSGGEPLELMVERAQKIAIPCATLIIILFGMPLANSSARASAAYGIGISLGITIFYMMFFKIAGALGTTGVMAPTLAAWLPNLVFLGAAGVLWGRVRT